jgi:hypothetical protein
MNRPLQISPGTIYRAQRPVRDPLYRRFIKQLPCLACLRTWGIDPCHTGAHGVGQKACDLKCIPLCRKCHQEYDAAPYDFAAKHGIDVQKHIARLNEFYRTKILKEAA